MSGGRSLELFYVDGTPEGIVTAEVFGWTGHALRVPRTALKAGLARAEAGYTGVYLLRGRRDDRPLLYVGEGEGVARRLRDHEAKKDWWDEVVVVVASANALHKAHAKYLEAALLRKAQEAGARLDNGQGAEAASLNEAAVANMEAFVETLLMVLPALGVDDFRSGRRSAEAPQAAVMPDRVFRLRTPKNGVEASAMLRGDGFVVRAGSRARKRWEGKGDHDFGYRALHAKLVAEGVLRQEADHAVMIEDYAFNSPSAAAAVMNGRPANGRLEWKLPDGRSYGDLEAAELEEVVP